MFFYNDHYIKDKDLIFHANSYKLFLSLIRWSVGGNIFIMIIQ